MTPIFKLQRDDISPMIRRYAAEMKKGLREVVKSTAKGITRRVIDITPPASAGMTGADAYRAGRFKIARQMSALLAPVKLKGRRKITTVFGHKLRRPVYVPTKELHPDVAGIYRDSTRALSGRVGIRLKNYTGRKYYVDVAKFQSVLRDRQAHVGELASGWAAAATALDVPMQQWISRHGAARGRIQIDTAGDRMRVVAQNIAPGLPANLRDELGRRIAYAVQYQADSMERSIQGYHNRIRQSLGIRGAAR